MIKILRKFTIPLIITILAIPLILPYLKSGYFPTHDGEWAVVRLADMFRELRDLQFPARFSGALNFGYGYPLFNFAYPGPYYLGIIFYFLTHSFVMSVKIIFLLSVVLSGFFMYLASSELWKSRIAGVVSSIIYLYLPYRMVDLYVRGSIGESISFALFPLILYLSLRLFATPFSRVIVFLLSLSIAFLITTHNIMTVLFMPVLIVFIFSRIIFEKKWDVLQSFFLSLILGLGIASFFWIPAIFEKNYILLSQIPIADRSLYFVNIKQLIIPSWGYAPPTESGGFSYQIGIGQTIGFFVVAFVFLKSFLKSRFIQPPAFAYVGILILLFVACFTFLFGFTSVIWKSTPLLREINYPWTLLSQIGFIISILVGFVVTQGRTYRYIAYALCLISVIMVFPYAKPQSYVNRGEEFYLTNEATTTSSDELMPLWVKQKPTEHYESKVEAIKGKAIISNLKFDSNSLSFDYKAEEDPTFKINTIYYPGWDAYLNYEKTNIRYDNPEGVMIINANKYRNKVTVVLNDTFLRTTANIVSILSLVLLAFVLIRPALKFR